MNNKHIYINSDKTQLMVSSRSKYFNYIKNFTFNAKNYIIEHKNSIKILRITLKHDMNMDLQVGNLCANLHNRINTIWKLTKYTTFHTRLQFTYAMVIGELNYCLPIYTQISKHQTKIIHKVIMSAARAIIGSFCFKKSTN